MNNFNEKVSFIWSVADLLRGPYRPNQYKDVMLPLTVLRRLDCVLEPTKDKVLEAKKKWSGKGKGVLDAKLVRVAGVPFYNTSRFTFGKLKGDQGRPLHAPRGDPLDGELDLYAGRRRADHGEDR